jgi:CBS-domain-containing membrane protein
LQTTSQRQFPVVSATGDYLGMLDITATTAQEPCILVDEILDPVPPIRADAPAEEELSLIGRGGRSAVAVIDNTTVVGILRAADIARVANHALAHRGSTSHRSGHR